MLLIRAQFMHKYVLGTIHTITQNFKISASLHVACKRDVSTYKYRDGKLSLHEQKAKWLVNGSDKHIMNTVIVFVKVDLKSSLIIV